MPPDPTRVIDDAWECVLRLPDGSEQRLMAEVSFRLLASVLQQIVLLREDIQKLGR